MLLPCLGAAVDSRLEQARRQRNRGMNTQCGWIDIPQSSEVLPTEMVAQAANRIAFVGRLLFPTFRPRLDYGKANYGKNGKYCNRKPCRQP